MLGYTDYYHKFIPAYSDLVRQHHKADRKKLPTILIERYHKSFEMLKEALKQSPFLVYHDPSNGYVLFTDASTYT